MSQEHRASTDGSPSAEVALIRALSGEPRASITKLADQLGVSRTWVSAHLATLREQGDLRIVAAVDPILLNKQCLAHLSVTTNAPVAEVADALRPLTDVVFLSAVGGAPDLVVEVRAREAIALRGLIAHVRGMPGVTSVTTLTYDDILHGFFVPNGQRVFTPDAVDAAIANALQRDGRASLQALAADAGVAPSTVAARMQRMLDAGVIRLGVFETRGRAARQVSMGVGIRLGRLAPSARDPLFEVRELPGVEFLARTFGRFDASATVTLPTIADHFATLDRIRRLRGIESIESWLHLQVFKEDYAGEVAAIPSRS